MCRDARSCTSARRSCSHAPEVSRGGPRLPGDRDLHHARAQRREACEGVAVEVDDPGAMALAPVDELDGHARPVRADRDRPPPPVADPERRPGSGIEAARVSLRADAPAGQAVPAGRPGDARAPAGGCHRHGSGSRCWYSCAGYGRGRGSRDWCGHRARLDWSRRGCRRGCRGRDQDRDGLVPDARDGPRRKGSHRDREVPDRRRRLGGSVRSGGRSLCRHRTRCDERERPWVDRFVLGRRLGG
jgi:hypothetical protein